jgi:manganese/zinc/iron transport system permease protein
MSMVGDAISHAVLPGIVISFLLSGSRETIPMLLGAGMTGLLATLIIEYFHRKAKLQTDASIGVTFTFLFAIGMVLISMFAGQVDLDQDCVLYGEIAYVPIDLWITQNGVNMGPRPVYTLSVIFVLVLLLVVVGYRHLSLTTFDAAFATAVGFSASLWHYLLMGAVSLATVGSFESVGAILVIAFLIGPPATAYLLTDRLPSMMVVTVILGILIAFIGYWLAYWLDASIAGSMAVVTGGIFAVVFVYSRRHRAPESLSSPGDRSLSL